MRIAKKEPPQNPVNVRTPTANTYCGTLLIGMAKKKPPQNPANGRAKTTLIYMNTYMYIFCGTLLMGKAQ